MRLIVADNGLLKNAKGKRILLLSKTNNINLPTAKSIKEILLDKNFDGKIIIEDIKKKLLLRSNGMLTGIVLASGFLRRMKR